MAHTSTSSARDVPPTYRLFWQDVPRIFTLSTLVFLGVYGLLLAVGFSFRAFTAAEEPALGPERLLDGVQLCVSFAASASLLWFFYLHVYGPWAQARAMSASAIRPLLNLGFERKEEPLHEGLMQGTHLEGLWQGYYCTISYEVESAIGGCFCLQLHFEGKPRHVRELANHLKGRRYEWLPHLLRVYVRTGFGQPHYDLIRRRLNTAARALRAHGMRPGLWAKQYTQRQS